MPVRRCSRCSNSASFRSSTRTTLSSTDEIKFGDNDTLAALVTNLVEADVLVILTDQAGLYSADPRVDPAASLVRSGIAGAAELEAMAGGAGSAIARGGMLTKILAAKRAVAQWCRTR